MNCPACSRPVAMARGNCVYCGAPLPEDVLMEAASAAQRVLRSKSLAGLESAAQGLDPRGVPRRYVVIETSGADVSTIAEACSVSAWEARQWQIASRYRLVKVSGEPEGGPLESRIKETGLRLLVIPEEEVARARHPIQVESIDIGADPVVCAYREDPEAPAIRKPLPEGEIVLIVSGPIKRDRHQERTAKGRSAWRLDDAWLVHLHFRDEPRPWEIDPRRTTYEGPGLASAHMRTVELIRRLSSAAPLDEGFKNVVPALAPALDPASDLEGLKTSKAKSSEKEPKAVLLDNAAQFYEYSAWRAAIERLQGVTPRDQS